MSGADGFRIDGNTVRVSQVTEPLLEPLPPRPPNILPFPEPLTWLAPLNAAGWALFAVSALDYVRQKWIGDWSEKLPEDAIATNPAPDRAWRAEYKQNPLVDPRRELFPNPAIILEPEKERPPLSENITRMSAESTAETLVENQTERANELWDRPTEATPEDLDRFEKRIRDPSVSDEELGWIVGALGKIQEFHPDRRIVDRAFNLREIIYQREMISNIALGDAEINPEDAWKQLETALQDRDPVAQFRYVAILFAKGEQARLWSYPDLRVRYITLVHISNIGAPFDYAAMWERQRPFLVHEIERGGLDIRTPLLTLRIFAYRGVIAAAEQLKQYATMPGFLGEEAQLVLKLGHPKPTRDIVRGVTGGTVRRAGPKIGPNEPCPCGSGKKFKKCHG